MQGDPYRMMAIMLFVILALVFVAIGCRDSGLFDRRQVKPVSSSCGVSAKRVVRSVPANDDGTDDSPWTNNDMASPTVAKHEAAQQKEMDTTQLKNPLNYGLRLTQTREGPTFARTKGAYTSTAHQLHAMCSNNGKPLMPTIDKSCNGLWFHGVEEHYDYRNNH
jgi:hypothetical protein